MSSVLNPGAVTAVSHPEKILRTASAFLESRPGTDMKLECLRIAAASAKADQWGVVDVMTLAKAMYAWVTADSGKDGE